MVRGVAKEGTGGTMSERTTGATDEQIEAAARRMLAIQSSGRTISKRYLTLTAREAQYWVTPEHRIVSVADLREMLDAFMTLACSNIEDDELIDRIQAAIGDAP